MVAARSRLACALAALAAVGATAVPAAGGPAAASADVTLQVVVRGHGTVTTSGGRTCTAEAQLDACDWTFPSGSTAVLAPHPQGGGAVRWSTAECTGAGECRLALEEDTSIVAFLGKIQLKVDTSGAEAGDVVTSDTGGIRCPPTCVADFDYGATVRLTVTSGPGSTFTSFPYGCTSVNGRVCTATVLGQPVGVKYNGQQGPAPPAVKVRVKIRKDGNGAGRVTAAGVDCGTVCFASFQYGDLAVLTAAPDSGSVFDGWGGVCAADREVRCSLPIGPITLVRPRFAKESPPGAPGAIAATGASATSVTIRWGAPTGGAAVRAYEVYVGDGADPRVTTSATTATVGGLACGRKYPVAVLARDGAGNPSPRTSAVVATAPCALRITLVGAPAVRQRPSRRLVCRLRSSVGARGSLSLVVGGVVRARRKIVLAAGTTTVALSLPRSVAGTRGRLRVSVALPQGGTRTFSWAVRVGR
jgi:hypothetical protein